MSKITVNTAQVEEIADAMNRLNTKLNDTLEASRDTVNGLQQVWSGQASEESRSAYNNFAKKYFDTYRQLIDQYVVFLREAVAKGYYDVETANSELSDAFN